MRWTALLAAVLLIAGCTPSSTGTRLVPPTPPPQAPLPPVSVHIPTQPMPHPEATLLPVPSVGDTGDIARVVEVAKSWLGVPYAWGGCSKTGVDCSCLVRNLLAVIGINAPRTTVQQIAWAAPIPAGEARAGDLVFFDNTCTNCGSNPTHVGMVISTGVMVDAGDPVRVEPIYSGHNARYGRVPGL